MTKKDYERLAKALKADMVELNSKPYSELSDWESSEAYHVGKRQGAYDQWHTTVLAIADTLQADNPRFDRTKFLVACKA